MKQLSDFRKRIAVSIFFLGIFLILTNNNLVNAKNSLEQGLMPTVTGTPLGPQITVLIIEGQEQINVRSGPHVTFEKVGVLVKGQSAAALGKTASNEWILIEYPGVENGQAWVYAPLVSISPGDLPIVEPPSTPTPAVTPTIDPTMAARFIISPLPTRLATYTEVVPLSIPTFEDTSTLSQKAGIPIGLVILVVGAIGLFMGLFTIAQGR
jgi:hypothetical protein